MSSKTTTIQIRVDEDLKKKAAKILSGMHISMSGAIKMFLGQVVRQDGIGIEFRTPSKELQKRMDETDADIGLHEVGSVGELFEELERCEFIGRSSSRRTTNGLKKALKNKLNS